MASLWTLTNASRLDPSARKPLADLLLETIQFNASDRRDRIFALLGLSREESDPLVQSLFNYDEGSEDETFRGTTRYLLEKLQTLEPLSLASS